MTGVVGVGGEAGACASADSVLPRQRRRLTVARRPVASDGQVPSDADAAAYMGGYMAAPASNAGACPFPAHPCGPAAFKSAVHCLEGSKTAPRSLTRLPIAALSGSLFSSMGSSPQTYAGAASAGIQYVDGMQHMHPMLGSLMGNGMAPGMVSLRGHNPHAPCSMCQRPEEYCVVAVRAGSLSHVSHALELIRNAPTELLAIRWTR